MNGMNKKILREKLRGYEIFNEWERQEERRTLPRLTIEESVQQYLALQALMRQLAPDAHLIFFEDDLDHRVHLRKQFKRIAKATRNGSPR